MSHKKRLCIIPGPHFSARTGGAQYQAQCIVEELVKIGEFEIYYLTRLVDPNYRAQDYTIVLIPGKPRKGHHEYVLDMWQINKILRDLQPHVIYQRVLSPDTAAAAFYARRAGCKMVLHIAHDDDVRPFVRRGTRSDIPNYIDKKVSEYGLRRAHRIVAQTQRQADMLWSNYGLRVATVMGNFGPETQEAIVKSGPVKVIWVANFKAPKRPECFVELVESLRDRRDVEFHMIGRPGDPRLYADLHRRIAALPNLKYHGEQPIDQVNELLARGHVFVNTSTAEGFPNTFIQAWMREVPIVSLTVDPDDILVKHRIGFCSGTAVQLKQDVLRLIEQDQLRAEMGKRARAYALEHHSVRNVQRLINLL
jgi:glycosyltransferase involved in cell wall biosynthesis